MSEGDLEAFRRELDVFLQDTVSIDGRRAIFVSLAEETLGEFEEMWRQAAGADVEFERFVDGAKDAPLTSVRIPGGLVFERVMPIGDVVVRAIELFRNYTKVVTGGYGGEHETWLNMAKGTFRDPDPAPGDQVDIVNVASFARKAEVRGFSDLESAGFPQGWGLMQGIASQLRDEFRGLPVPIRAVWDEYAGERLPAVRIG